MSELFHVGVLTRHYLLTEPFLRGIVRYARARSEPWRIHVVNWGENDPAPDNLKQYDGLICHFGFRSEQGQCLEQSGRPVVMMANSNFRTVWPTVMYDHRATGRLAARELLTLGYRHLAFVGRPEYWSRSRERGFSELLQEQVFPYMSWVLSPDRDLERPCLREHLEDVSKPVAILAANDQLGRMVLDCCEQLDLDVPHQVAVLGVDNMFCECELGAVTLSSIAMDQPRVGWLAAEVLEQIVQGQWREVPLVEVPPRRCIHRQSTRHFDYADPHLREALLYIREYACEGITPKDVAQAVGQSRSGLYAVFQSVLGRGISERIRSEQLQRVCEYLLGTNLPLAAIAARTGFRSLSYLCQAFRREFGRTPTAWRNQARSAGPEWSDSTPTLDSGPWPD